MPRHFQIDSSAIERRNAPRYWPMQPVSAAIETPRSRVVGHLVNYSVTGFLLKASHHISEFKPGESITSEFLVAGKLEKVRSRLIRVDGQFAAVRFLEQAIFSIPRASVISEAGAVSVEAGVIHVNGTFNYHVLREVLAYLGKASAPVDLSGVTLFKASNADFLSRVTQAGGKIIGCSEFATEAADQALACLGCNGCSRSVSDPAEAGRRRKKTITVGGFSRI